jgi:hypothetical protein
MPRTSVLQAFLDKFPEERRVELEKRIRSAPTIKEAYLELKGLKYRGSYDSVQFWRANDARGRIENVQRSADAVAGTASRQSAESDPIEAAMVLANELNSLCSSLVGLLQKHEWLEPGEVRLSNREAAKILTAIPAVSRAASGTLVEMVRVRAKLDERALCLALIEELRTDWERILTADNPELIPVFEDVARVTRARLEIDSESLLERVLERSSTLK